MLESLAILLIPAASWLIMFLGTRVIAPRIRSLPDGVQAILALFSTSVVTWVATHFDVVLTSPFFTPENVAVILTAWLASMGIHTVAKPGEEVVAAAVHGGSPATE